MKSKEKVLTTSARQVPDRVPINYFANPGIDARFKAHYGWAPHGSTGLRDILGVGFRGVGNPCTVPETIRKYEN
jgi:uroporphyrinogen decarboxylase